jgi:hypothetical protein
VRPLPPGLVRLGAPLPPEVHREARALARCSGRVPVGAVLLEGSDDLGPLAPGEHVTVRVLGSYAAVRVPTGNDAVLAAAVRTARLATPAGARQDVLVLRAVASVHAGRVATGPPDRVRAVEGEAHELDGADQVRELLLRRIGRVERAHRGADRWRTPLPPWGMRLSRLVRDVLRSGPADELTWADDGRTCRLLGVRSLG